MHVIMSLFNIDCSNELHLLSLILQFRTVSVVSE